MPYLKKIAMEENFYLGTKLAVYSKGKKGFFVSSTVFHSFNHSPHRASDARANERCSTVKLLVVKIASGMWDV